jgi:hypothetical protein
MKTSFNNSKFYLYIFSMMILFCGCNKDKTPTPKNYAASINDKTWWGVVTYTGKTPQYYSVHFNTDNTLLWSQLSGDFPGTWTINNKSVVMKFGGPDKDEVKADITEDDKFTTITDNNPKYEIINGQLVADPNIPLENTTWKGTIFSVGTSSDLQLKFLPSLQVELTLNSTLYKPFTYSRAASGGAFRFDTGGGYYYFGVITSAKEIKGSGNDPQFPFQVTKQ